MRKILIFIFGLLFCTITVAALASTYENKEKAKVKESSADTSGSASKPRQTELQQPTSSLQREYSENHSDSLFELAVEIIKKYEGLHTPKHYPLVGYGHKVLPGERYNRTKTLAESHAEELLRKDLLKNCAVFRNFGADSLLLGVLAYNIGSGNVKRSKVAARLAAGDRNIKNSYLSHCRANGKVLSQLQRRRAEEFEKLFIDIETITN